MISITKNKRDDGFRLENAMPGGFLQSKGKQEASMNPVEQIIFSANDRNAARTFRIALFLKVHEETCFVNIIP